MPGAIAAGERNPRDAGQARPRHHARQDRPAGRSPRLLLRDRRTRRRADDLATADQVLANPHTGALALNRAIDQFYTSDVFMQTWDLARATGQDDRLDPGFCAQLLAGMQQMEEVIRSSGQYGARVEVPDDADPQTRLLGFIGRDPFWTPPKTPRA